MAVESVFELLSVTMSWDGTVVRYEGHGSDILQMAVFGGCYSQGAARVRMRPNGALAYAPARMVLLLLPCHASLAVRPAQNAYLGNIAPMAFLPHHSPIP